MSKTKLTLSGVPGGSTTIIGNKSDSSTGGSMVPLPLPPEIENAGPWTRPKLFDGSDPDPLDLYGRGTFTLEYDGTVVTLPLPIIGDEQTLQSTVINRRTRGGKARVYRDLSWYTLHIYDYTFKHVRESIKDDFLTLTRDAMADPIKIIDHLDQVYLDMYIVDVGPVIEEHDDGCSYTLNMTMQVVR